MKRLDKDEEKVETPNDAYRRDRDRRTSSKDRRQAEGKARPYAAYDEAAVNIAADPVVEMMSADQLRKYVDKLRRDMLAAAKNMDFMEAARLRDEAIKMETKLDSMQ